MPVGPPHILQPSSPPLSPSLCGNYSKPPWLRSSDANYDPSKEAHTARKARMAKNERQRLQNVARSQQGTAAGSGVGAQAGRKREIERTLATTRASTASMGRFDRALEGEKKPRGLKRKVTHT
jgi:regulator of ribosome biosynthesis